MVLRLLYLIAIRVFGWLVLLGRGHASKASGTTSRSPGRPSQDRSPPTTGLIRTRHARRLARVVVLGENGALEHRNDRLAQYPLVAADDRIRSVTSARGAGLFQQLVTQGLQREPVHVLRHIQSAQRP